MKQATITNRVWSIKRQHNMDDDDFMVWMFLRVNSETTITGLYEITPHDMAIHLSPKSPSLILEIMQRLQGYGVITYDNGIVFVPDIPFDQNFHSYGHKKSTLAKTRKELGKYRSEIGGKNRAFLAFDAWHEETLAEIAMDEEFEAAHAEQDQSEEPMEDPAGHDRTSTEEKSKTTPILPPTTPSYPMGSTDYPSVAIEEENNKKKYNSNSISELGGGVGEGPPVPAEKISLLAAESGVRGAHGLPQKATQFPATASGPSEGNHRMGSPPKTSQRASKAAKAEERVADRSMAKSSGAVVGRLTEPAANDGHGVRDDAGEPLLGPECEAGATLAEVAELQRTGASSAVKAGTIEATTFPPDTEQVRAVMAEYIGRRDVRMALGEHMGRINTAKETLKFLDHYATFRKPAWTKTNNLPVTDWVQAAQHWIREWPRFNSEDEGRSGGAGGEAHSSRSLQDIDRDETELLHVLTGDLQ